MFYTYRQNNSGGYYIINNDVSVCVSIEADNEYEAMDKFDSITGNYSEYCECCGKRWYSYDSEVSEDKPYIWGKPYDELEDKDIIIYYKDGSKLIINSESMYL